LAIGQSVKLVAFPEMSGDSRAAGSRRALQLGTVQQQQQQQQQQQRWSAAETPNGMHSFCSSAK